MTDLLEGQYALEVYGEEIIFGGKKTTPYYIEKFDAGTPTQNNNQVSAPRGDGEIFGRDYRGGRLLSFDGSVITRPGSTLALDALDDLESAWDPEMLRTQPGDVAVLRLRRGNRTRRVYGRPRRFASTPGTTQRGWIPFSCDFQTIDSRFYDDVELVETIGMVPDAQGGLIGPLIGPLYASGQGDGSGILPVAGSKPSWLTTRINGPIINPGIELVGQWKFQLNITLAYDQWVLIDPTPWSRMVRRNDGANFAGKFTAGSVRLSEMRMPRGQQQVLLTGVDASRTATAQLYWRDTYASY